MRSGFFVGRGGFEPPKQVAADLQSVPFGHSGICPFRQGIALTLRKYTIFTLFTQVLIPLIFINPFSFIIPSITAAFKVHPQGNQSTSHLRAAPSPLPRESNSTKIVEILSTIPTVIRLCLLLALTLHARLSVAERLHSNFLVLLSGRFCEVDIRACPSKLAFYVFYMATRLAQTDEGHAHISQNPPARRTQKFSNCKSFCREQPGWSAQTFKRHN